MGQFPNPDTQFSSTNQPAIPGGVNKKGSKHLATHIQEMMDDPDFEVKLKDGGILRGRPIEAIIKTAVAKAISGDMRAFDMLGKYGWGNKVVHDFEPGLFTKGKLQIELVDDPKTEPETEEGA